MKQYFVLLLALLFSVAPVFAAPTVFIVRHAEKAQTGDTKDPDLSEAGRARAVALAKVLQDAGISEIYATEFKRTQQTAEPLARAAHLAITIVPAKDPTALAAKLKDGNALVVAHSNTIPEIMKALGLSAPPEIDEAEYDNLFVLIPGSPAKLLRLHYR